MPVDDQLAMVGRLVLAALLGAFVGIEREVRGYPAGVRTIALVALGSALFTEISAITGTEDRIAAGIVTGIGFLGAGVIFREGYTVRGITTAATVWSAAAVGMAVGRELYLAAGLGSLLIFVLLEARDDEEDWPRLAQAMCDRHFGVGADGLILVLPSSRADVRMRMFNPDGSEAEMCGNGIRCLAKFAAERGIATPRDGVLLVDTLAGLLRCEVSGTDGHVERVRASMGRPRLAPNEIPVLAESSGPLLDLPIHVEGGDFRVTCVSMGNPHAVHFQDEPVAAVDLEHIGPRVEHHPAFPRRVNFEIVNVLGRDRLRMRVWERGAGITLACGTGACATAVAARLRGLVDDVVEVELPGGTVRIEWDGTGDVFLSGPAEDVFEGRWLHPV